MLRVVIIDGNAISRALLHTVLTEGGHQVIGDSNTSPSNVAKMIGLDPQLVCVDVAYADDGWALVDEIRTALPKAIICMVSGKFEAATIEEGATKHGVHGFIAKPFKGATVMAIIRNAILKVVRKQQAKLDTQDAANGENAGEAPESGAEGDAGQ
ncbi:MAG: response regulator [Burkholderiaceae bacterium]|nr:response regulator [Burkholderiaceae bacterium]